MFGRKKDTGDVTPADSSSGAEDGRISKAESETIEQVPTNMSKDLEAGGHYKDASRNAAAAEGLLENDHSYHNFQPIADLQLEDWRATEKRLVRILDCTLMPTLWITYLNNYLDRTNISQAMTAGMDDDLGLSGDDFNTALAVLTVGYMLAQLPSNVLLTRVRPSIYLPVTVMIWSSVSIATAFATNAQTLYVIRFFLGVTEAPLFPGVGRSFPMF